MPLCKSVIVVISGYAVAGRLGLALWCDLRVAEEDSVLGVFCRRWGVPLIDSGTVRLPALVGLGQALDLILTGRGVAAPEALAMGLLSRVVPRGKTLAAARQRPRDCGTAQTCLRSDRASATGRHLAQRGPSSAPDPRPVSETGYAIAWTTQAPVIS